MKILMAGQTTILRPLIGVRPIAPELWHSIPRIVDAVVIALEALLAYAWLMQLISAEYLIVAHFAVVLGYFRASASIAGNVSGAIVSRTAMLFLVGPLACLGLVTHLVADRCSGRPKSDRAPYDGIAATPSPADLRGAHAETVYAQIAARRRARRDSCNRQSLQQAIESGDLGAQQFAIAMISQRYEPEMFPALASALRSSTPAVRVQAAAVFAKLRERMSGEAKEILQTQGDLLADAAGAVDCCNSTLVARCRRLADSGFVDPETGLELQRVADALEAGGGPNTHGSTTRMARRSDAAPVAEMPPLASRDYAVKLGGG